MSPHLLRRHCMRPFGQAAIALPGGADLRQRSPLSSLGDVHGSIRDAVLLAAGLGQAMGSVSISQISQEGLSAAATAPPKDSWQRDLPETIIVFYVTQSI